MKTDSGNESALIADAMNGDLEAFNQLVMKYQELAYGHSYALVRDAYEADDITQESFLKAFQNLAQFRGGSFRAWLMRIVTNTSFDLLRSFKKHPTQRLFPSDTDGEENESVRWSMDPEADVETIFDRRETSKCLSQALEDIPAHFRSVLTLIDIYDLDYWEAAEILRIPLGTVKSRLARARLQMRGKIRGASRASVPLTGLLPAAR